LKKGEGNASVLFDDLYYLFIEVSVIMAVQILVGFVMDGYSAMSQINHMDKPSFHQSEF
jgi:hypothetical protein